MTRCVVVISILLITSLACVAPAWAPTVTPTPIHPIHLPTRTPRPAREATEEAQTATIQATVYVRQSPDASSDAIGSLTTGQRVEIVNCSGEWCRIKKPAGYVWRGCTDNNPDGLLCQAKP